MDQPPASSKLPKGWQNMPETVLRDVTLNLPHADAAAHCESFTRMGKICDNNFWREKAEIDLSLATFEIVYTNPYFNYLAARVRYLQSQARRVLFELIPNFDVFRERQNKESGWDRTTNIDKFIKTVLKLGDYLLFERILQQKVKMGELKYTDPQQYSESQKLEIIQDYFKEKAPVRRQIRKLE